MPDTTSPREERAALQARLASLNDELVEVTGTRDLSHIGESDAYPTGHGCEVCS